jgi:hypothetical protein
LARRTFQPALTTSRVANGIIEVADLSTETRTVAPASQSAARDLDRASARLHDVLSRFTTA